MNKQEFDNLIDSYVYENDKGDVTATRLNALFKRISTMIYALDVRLAELENSSGSADTIELTGSFSYSDIVPASGGSVTPANSLQLVKNGVAQTVVFTYSVPQAYASVDSSTGVLTFQNSTSANRRVAVVTASCVFEGQTYTRMASVTQEAYVINSYSVTRNLTGVNSSNSTNSVTESSSYTTTLSLASGYQDMSVTVTMGGTNITSSALNGNVVTIASVTGNVVITATATQIPVVTEYVYAGSVRNSTSDPVSISQFTSGASSTTKTINYTPTEIVNTIIAVCPSTMNLTSCVKHGEIEEVITSEMLASVSNVTYDNKSCKMYQFKFGVSIRNVAFTITFN